jgi:excisionase family DNA binding protein
MENESDQISTTEAGERLGISRKRVNQLIEEGRLPAKKIGKTWIINADDLKLVKDRKWGRPRKKKTDDDDDE